MDSFFPILAIETSGDLCSIAVMMDVNVFVELNYLQKHIHSEKIMGMIESVLSSTSIDPKNLKAITVSIGPGSFTGLRIGLSAAKGMAFGLKLPLLPVPTDYAYALQISQYLPDNSKFILVSNASTDDVYFSKFVKRGKLVDVLEGLKLVDKTDLINHIANNETAFGNIENENIIKLNHGLSAASIGRWAYLFGKDLLTFEYDYLEPNYFKKFAVKGKS